MILFDSHAHLDSRQYKTNIDELLADEELLWVLTIGTELESSLAAVNIAEKYHRVWAAVGVHPHFADQYSNYIQEKLKITACHPKVLAIGEIGLDYHYMHSTKENQMIALRQQIRLAKDLNLPIIVHIREAMDDAIDILLTEKAHEVGGILHSYPGDLKTACTMIENNFRIGLNGIITFKNFKRSKMLTELPLDKIVVETDCPYLTPEPHRGKVNKPEYVDYVVERIADLKSLTPSEVAETTAFNACNLLNIPFVNKQSDQFHQKKSFSQIFLNDMNYRKKIAALIPADEHIVEIGPGEGAITELLIDRIKSLIAVEYDIDLARELHQKNWAKVKVINRDFLTIDLDKIYRHLKRHRFMVIGNLPYHITNPILIKLLESKGFISQAVLMIQKEVGRKLLAEVGDPDHGITSVLMQLGFALNKKFTVPAGAFFPTPTVDSLVLTLTPREYEQEPPWDILIPLVRGAFNKKRKTAINSLQDNPFFTLSKENARQLFEQLELPPNTRAERISPDVFLKMSKHLGKGFT